MAMPRLASASPFSVTVTHTIRRSFSSLLRTTNPPRSIRSSKVVIAAGVVAETRVDLKVSSVEAAAAIQGHPAVLPLSPGASSSSKCVFHSFVIFIHNRANSTETITHTYFLSEILLALLYHSEMSNKRLMQLILCLINR